jgi:hypothetical protein
LPFCCHFRSLPGSRSGARPQSGWWRESGGGPAGG